MDDGLEVQGFLGHVRDVYAWVVVCVLIRNRVKCFDYLPFILHKIKRHFSIPVVRFTCVILFQYECEFYNYPFCNTIRRIRWF